jgi:S1-C subfamily serine protease
MEAANEAQLLALSSGIAAAGARAAAAVVRVEGRGRPGSGVAWSDDVVVTAAHAVEAEDEVEVGLPSGETVRGAVVGRDPATDLAALRLPRAAGLAPPAWRERPPAAGELALAISRPGHAPRLGLALVARVSAGEWRAPGGARLDRFVELDVALHPGLSGGLAVDLAGGALGVASAGIVRATALAIPAATLRRVVGSLLAHGAMRRGYLGVATVPVRLPTALRPAAGQDAGLLVSGLDEQGPAASAGVSLGDVLLALDGHALAHPGELVPLLEEERIGAAVAVRLLRAGEARELPVAIAARGAGGRPP